jgi:serine/threonine-protein kinase
MNNMGERNGAFAATVADQTQAATPAPASEPVVARGSQSALELSARSTVLPRLSRVSGAVASQPNAPRFVPMRTLGSGGLGEVTLVKDNDIDREVALKRLHSHLQTEELVYRFAQEIRTVGQLEHPNIAPVHDVGIDDNGRHYFVMRYVAGETLEAIIARLRDGDPAYHAKYTFPHRAQIFLGVLHAIEYAHAKGVIHRDIKPANIMVGPYGEVVVMDWGIAKKKDDGAPAPAATPASDSAATGEGHDALYRTRHGSLVGTPAYMSPEQARGEIDRIDERSDVYALSVVLYELLTLRHYLHGCTTVTELLAQIVDGEHLMAAYQSHPHQTDVPAELGWFLEKGLSKAPSDRFQSVVEMSEQLERVMAGAFPIQCPITFVKRAGNVGLQLVDRHRLASLVGASLIVLVVVAAFVDLLSRVL